MNSVAWNNSSPMSLVGTQRIAASTVTYSVVQNGYPGIGNFASDPLPTSDFPLGNAPDCNGNGQLDDCVAPPLNVDVNQISLALGGTQTFTLTSAAPLSTYFLFGTTSGTSLGLSSRGFTLPLNFDSYCVNPNQPPLTNSLGVLLPSGGGLAGATALLVLPAALDPALAGLTLQHAYLTLDPTTAAITGASNPVPLTLLP